jgi:hypothetical protein
MPRIEPAVSRSKPNTPPSASATIMNAMSIGRMP